MLIFERLVVSLSLIPDLFFCWNLLIVVVLVVSLHKAELERWRCSAADILSTGALASPIGVFGSGLLEQA